MDEEQLELFDELDDHDKAVALLSAGEPVPTDIIYRLVEQGVDFAALEAKHAP